MHFTTKILTRSALILALAIVVQSIRLPQYFTGPLVNTLLFLASALVSPISGVIVGLFTPLLAFSMGIMPLAPAVPVIMLGNSSLALIFGLLRQKPILGVIFAAVGKYAVMALSVFYLFPMLLHITFPQKLLATLTTPQLFTALGGGLIALIVLRALGWKKVIR